MALFIIYVYCRIVNQKIRNPVKDILDTIKKIENEKFNQVVPVKHGISEFDTIYDSLVRMKDSLVYLRECVYQKDLYTQQIELKQLQAQVNPHFLYNSFFTVSRMLDNEDYDSAAEMCRYLGEFFSYITRNARMMIPMQEELRHAQFYLKIQKIRFADRLEIFYASEPPWTEKMMIPKLVIQPVLENFMKYVAEKEKGKAILHISFMEKDSCRAVIIEDNGSDMSDEKLAALQMKLLNVSPSEEITGLLNIS